MVVGGNAEHKLGGGYTGILALSRGKVDTGCLWVSKGRAVEINGGYRAKSLTT